MITEPKWFVFVHDSQYGPVALHELIEWLKDGRVTEKDLIWDFVGEKWLPAKSFPELRNHLQDREQDEYAKSVPDGKELAGTKVYFSSYREGSSDRQYIRMPACLRLTYQELNPFDGSLVSKPTATTVENISPGGLAFEIYNKKLQKRGKVQLELKIPGREDRPIQIIAEITRVVNYQHHRSLIGVGFRETNQEDQEDMFAYMRSLISDLRK